MLYFDNNSTTFIDPRVLEVMQQALTQGCGNPSSLHQYGQKARQLLVGAMQQIARFFHVRPEEVLFTSGATEAINLLIRGYTNPKHIITSSLEHVATRAAVAALEKKGCKVSYVEPDHNGQIKRSAVEACLLPETSLIVLMGVNNETGIVNDWENIAKLALEKNIPFLMDGVALLGKLPFTFPQGITAACFSAHKIHGPQGVGFALIRKNFPWRSWIEGGPQQFGMRGGTENLAGIIGLAKALELMFENQDCAIKKMQTLRMLFETTLRKELEIVVHGENAPRICNTSNISFPRMQGETFLIRLDQEGVAASHGSACSSGSREVSHVLLNMGVDPKLVRTAIRFSFSRNTQESEIEKAIRIICNILK